ncbi:4-hydroxyphenylacetate 3-monooxygenase, oxygenase component [Rummeliibacillus sp. NPDC094406]|uniref:4-hydroxyphenylacetate 3-monooxygenase, oxygenase component n=1 Tax=Rummeliibacillus sp. NPDC094406 TaxID=3364511 RepID=UPI0037F977B4
MPAITGAQYIDRINKLNTNVWIDGKQVMGNISEHPAFKGVMQSQASLYDLQNDDKLKDKMTYTSPSTGEAVGLSFLMPKTKEDLAKKRAMVQQWARESNGMMGRSPDYMNTTLMTLAASAHLLEGEENCFPENIRKYYEYVRDNDLSLTHTFIEPQVDRSLNYWERSAEPISASIVDRTDEGLVIKGARLLATQGGITDEMLLVSAGRPYDDESGFAFSIPSNSKGLKFICRESFVGGDSKFNYPLSSRFEEMDTIVVFDNVLVPWDRVFFYDNIDVAQSYLNQSSFQPFALHQVLSRQIVKTEFMLGIVLSIIDSINISIYQHVQEKAAEIMVALETLKALVIKSEVEAKVNESGLMQPDFITLRIANNIFAKVYPRFTEIVQLLGASGLMSIPTESAFHSPIRKDLDQYLQSKGNNAEDRVKLFRLAWDATMSPFGTRQTLYERFFFGDPVRLTMGIYQDYDKKQYVELIKRKLE